MPAWLWAQSRHSFAGSLNFPRRYSHGNSTVGTSSLDSREALLHHPGKTIEALPFGPLACRLVQCGLTLLSSCFLCSLQPLAPLSSEELIHRNTLFRKSQAEELGQCEATLVGLLLSLTPRSMEIRFELLGSCRCVKTPPLKFAPEKAGWLGACSLV